MPARPTRASRAKADSNVESHGGYEMDGKGNLVLDFLDVYGDRPDDRVDVTLKHQELSQTVHVKNHAASKRLRITELESTHGGLFSLQVFPLRRRSVGRFVRVLVDKTVQQS